MSGIKSTSPLRNLQALLLCVGLLVQGVNALALDEQPVDEHSIKELLQGIEWQLPKKESIQLDAQGKAHLADIIKDEQQALYIRERAMAVLALYPDLESWTLVKSVYSAQTGRLKRKALDVLCGPMLQPEILSKQIGELSTPLINNLKHTSPQVRVASARCLKQIQLLQPSAEGLQALKDYEQSPLSDWERQAAGLLI